MYGMLYFDLGEIKGLNKEEVRSLEGEKDKDEDSCAESSKHSILPVDLSAVRRAFAALFKLKTSIFENALINALVTLAGNLQMELPTRKERENQDDIVNVLLIVFEIPALGKIFLQAWCVSLSFQEFTKDGNVSTIF